MNTAVLLEPHPDAPSHIFIAPVDPSLHPQTPRKTYRRYGVLLAFLAAGALVTGKIIAAQALQGSTRVQQSLYASYHWNGFHRVAK